MSTNAGIRVAWTDVKGNSFHGIAYYRKQPKNIPYGRLLINVLNPDGTFLEDADGKHVCILKLRKNLTIVGYVD